MNVQIIVAILGVSFTFCATSIAIIQFFACRPQHQGELNSQFLPFLEIIS